MSCNRIGGMAQDDGLCHDGRCCSRAPRSLTLADLADKVRFGDDADQQVIATAYDNEIGMGFTQKFRRVDKWSISSDRDEPLACGR